MNSDADPALYSRKLLHHISVELERYDDITDENITSHDYYHLDPRTVIDVGYENLKEEARRENILGSTTVLLVLLRVCLLVWSIGGNSINSRTGRPTPRGQCWGLSDDAHSQGLMHQYDIRAATFFQFPVSIGHWLKGQGTGC